MMDDDVRSKLAKAIASKVEPKEESEAEEKSEASDSDDGPDTGLVCAMEDFVSAVNAKDPVAMAKALRHAKPFL